jgi:uncharacterized protein (DUF1778 family)
LGAELSAVANADTRRRSRRLEPRATPEESDVIDRASTAVAGTDPTTFVVTNAVEAARRVLADRTGFLLDAEGLAEWEAINGRRGQDLPGLRRLMARSAPFAG